VEHDMTVKSLAAFGPALAFATSLAWGAASAPDGAAIERIVAARAAYELRDWKAAIPPLVALTEEVPTNGRYRLMLARSRLETGDYATAAADYARALELDAGDPAVLAYMIAKCNALLGNSGEALRWLRASLEKGYRYLEEARRDTAFQALHGDREFDRLLGLTSRAQLSRSSGWRDDIAFLTEWVEKKSYHPFRTDTADRYVSGARYTREEFRAAARKLAADVPRLSDRAIELRLMELVASLGDGHTAVWGADRPEFAMTLPLSLYEFDEGLYVVAAAPKYRDLVGAQVLALDATPASAALARLDPLIGRDNAMWLRAMRPQQLRHLPFLKELGIARSANSVDLAIEDRAGTRRVVRVEADASEPDIWNALPKPKDWAWVADGSTADFQQRNAEAYWWAWRADVETLYVQYNKVLDAGNETLAQFAVRLRRAIDELPVRKLVIDMRNNNGGDTHLNEPMLKAIAGSKVDVLGRFYVIIGRRTFSAAMNAVSYFDRYTNAIFVGEPTGGKPNAPGDETAFKLPYSGIEVNLSDRYWQGSWPDDFSRWRAPDIAAPVSFRDFAEGRDAAMEAILLQPLP